MISDKAQKSPRPKAIKWLGVIAFILGVANAGYYFYTRSSKGESADYACVIGLSGIVFISFMTILVGSYLEGFEKRLTLAEHAVTSKPE